MFAWLWLDHFLQATLRLVDLVDLFAYNLIDFKILIFLRDGNHWSLVSYSLLFCLSPFSQTLNDWYDREIDAINEPYRPIPSGAISESDVSKVKSINNVTASVLQIMRDFLAHFHFISPHSWRWDCLGVL